MKPKLTSLAAIVLGSAVAFACGNTGAGDGTDTSNASTASATGGSCGRPTDSTSSTSSRTTSSTSSSTPSSTGSRTSTSTLAAPSVSTSASTPSGSGSSTRGSGSSTSASSSSLASASLGACPPAQGSGSSAGFTTRFWDCCKPSCGWQGTGLGNVPKGTTPLTSCSEQNQPLTGNFTAASSCNTGGTAYACYNLAPWAVNSALAYGFAAYDSGTCGQCYSVQFTGESNSVSNDPGSQSLCGKTMIVQVVNIGAIGANQFDIMVPGGGVGLNNACSAEWQSSNLGATYGGLLTTCMGQSSDYATQESCTLSACESLFSDPSQADLLAGCEWEVNWFGAANNPKIIYTPLSSCPSELTAISGLQ